MRKEAVIISLVLIVLMGISVVNAVQPIFTIGNDEVNYAVEFVNIDGTNVLLKVSNSSGYSNSKFISMQSEPYTVYNFPNTDLKIIVTNARIQNLDFNATILAGFEMDFSIEGDPQGNIINAITQRNLSIDGAKNSIEFVDASDNSVLLKITDSNENSQIKEIDIEQYQGPYNLYDGKKISDLLVILKAGDEQNLGISASTLIFYEKNFFVEPCDNECNVRDEKVCEGNGYKMCGDYDQDVCLEWDDVANCENDETCENGVCVKQDVPVTCTNECEILEEKGCFNDTNYHICGNFDDDGCLEWSKSILCTMGPIGRICVDNGECVGFPDLPTKECESIGLRENGKYCSPEYELEIQKINQEICENNFECKTNVCKENTCSAVKVIVEDKTWIIWLIIGGIILVIIISYFIWKKTKKQQPIQTQPQVQTK